MAINMSMDALRYLQAHANRMLLIQAIESLDISESLEITAMTSKEKERVPFDTPMEAAGIAQALLSHIHQFRHNSCVCKY